MSQLGPASFPPLIYDANLLNTLNTVIQYTERPQTLYILQLLAGEKKLLVCPRNSQVRCGPHIGLTTFTHRKLK